MTKRRTFRWVAGIVSVIAVVAACLQPGLLWTPEEEGVVHKKVKLRPGESIFPGTSSKSCWIHAIKVGKAGGKTVIIRSDLPKGYESFPLRVGDRIYVEGGRSIEVIEIFDDPPSTELDLWY